MQPVEPARRPQQIGAQHDAGQLLAPELLEARAGSRGNRGIGVAARVDGGERIAPRPPPGPPAPATCAACPARPDLREPLDDVRDQPAILAARETGQKSRRAVARRPNGACASEARLTIGRRQRTRALTNIAPAADGQQDHRRQKPQHPPRAAESSGCECRDSKSVPRDRPVGRRHYFAREPRPPRERPILRDAGVEPDALQPFDEHRGRRARDPLGDIERNPGRAPASARNRDAHRRKLVEQLVERDLSAGVELVRRTHPGRSRARRHRRLASQTQHSLAAIGAETAAASTIHPPQRSHARRAGLDIGGPERGAVSAPAARPAPEARARSSTVAKRSSGSLASARAIASSIAGGSSGARRARRAAPRRRRAGASAGRASRREKGSRPVAASKSTMPRL